LLGPSVGLAATRQLVLALTTIAILGWVPGNPVKLFALLLIWGLGLSPIEWSELVAFLAVNLVFILMNSAALQRGTFAFANPDVLGMPAYEFFMWGFYTLHTIRLLGSPPADHRWVAALAAAVIFAIPFATIADAGLLTVSSAGVLVGCLVLFHQWEDFAYVGYMALLGSAIEYTGVLTGQWHYPAQPYGGVPLWFLPMWGGVGLFTRRLVLPLLEAGRG
jgi:hypothetical protein